MAAVEPSPISRCRQGAMRSNDRHVTSAAVFAISLHLQGNRPEVRRRRLDAGGKDKTW
jgi:hypothetical protein